MEWKKIMVSIQEAADRTGLSNNCLRRLCQTNQINCMRNGGKYYINCEKLLVFLDKTHVVDAK